MADPNDMQLFAARLNGTMSADAQKALQLERFKAALRSAHAQHMANVTASGKSAEGAQVMSGDELNYLYGQDEGRKTPTRAVPPVEVAAAPDPSPAPVHVAIGVPPPRPQQATRKRSLEEEAAAMMAQIKAEQAAVKAQPVAVQAALDRNPYEPGY